MLPVTVTKYIYHFPYQDNSASLHKISGSPWCYVVYNPWIEYTLLMKPKNKKKCIVSVLKKKIWIPACPLDKHLHILHARGHFLLNLVSDLVREWLTRTLVHWASKL